ncbi:ACT domain-containing protein [Nocardioides sp. MH1]|uniref:ACT domain-containing protein n=1 Tax=Nocardioides sp. MH1 TaxID=3242490 RepID=UPI00352123EA
MSYRLARFPESIAVVRLGPGAEIPAWAESSSVFSITATATETSVVCAARSVPKKARHQAPFTAFSVVPEQGSADFDLSAGVTGVLAALLAPLAEAGVSVFVLSTFDTDWILVPKGDADKAEEAWRRSGHDVAPAVPVV